MGAGTILAAVARGPWPLLLLVSLTGWTALLGSGHGLVIPIYCSVSADHWVVLGWWSMEDALFFNPLEQLVVSWLLMLLAMMAPLLTQPISHLWHRSLARRRLRAMAIFVAGYATIWLVAGIILTIAAIILKALAGAGPLHASVFAIGIAVLWQVTPAKQMCLNRCHGLPRLSAFGVAADLDCLRYGFIAAVWCVGTCWALTLIPLVVEGMHILSMAAISMLLLAERLAPAQPARWRLPIQFRESDMFTVFWTKAGNR